MRALLSPAGLTLAVLVLFGLMLSSFWTGFLASDDVLYWIAAGKWLTQFPYVGDSHWALRQTLVLPMALARAVLGSGPVALVLPTLLYSIALLLMLTLWLHRQVGAVAAAAAMALIATNPQVITWSSTADIDPVQLFFVFAATILYVRAMGPGAHWGALLGSGVLAGLGYLSHETTVFAVAAIGLLFLAGYGMKRARYLPIAITFAAVALGEFLTLWAATGNPLYRQSISLNHDATINRWIEQGASVPIIHPLIDPLTMLLFNQSFGLLVWIGLPLAVWLFTRRRLDGPAQRVATVLATIAVTWAVLAAGLWRLLPLTPRYFLLPAVMLSILAGIAIQLLARGGHSRLAWGLGGLMFAANIGAVALSNRDLMFAEEALVEIAAREEGVIHTDQRTRIRADVPLGWRGLSAKVVATPPMAGELFFFNPARLPPGTLGDPDWTVVGVYGPPERPLAGFILRHLPAGLIPDKILRKFTPRRPEVTLYRVN
jgi:4-amino-4-deoxy-L-arabinose transferase-like glycosyltransferase